MAKRIIGMIAIAAVALAGCGADPGPPPAVGECFNVDPDDKQMTSVDAFSCDTEHDAEVYFVGDIDAPEEYDALLVDTRARGECFAAFSDYVGVDYYSSSIEILYDVPSQTAWGRGDRTVMCALYTPDDEAGTMARTTGSLNDSKK